MPEIVNGITVPVDGDPTNLPGDLRTFAEDVGTAAAAAGATAGAEAATEYASTIDDERMTELAAADSGSAFAAELAASIAQNAPPFRATPPDDPELIPAYLDVSTVPAVLRVWDGAVWAEISGDGGGGGVPPGTTVVRQIANRTSISTADKRQVGVAGVNNNQGGTYRTRHTARRTAYSIQLVYGNLGLVSGGDNDWTVAAAIELLDGTLHPLTFSGVARATMAPRGHVTSDKLTITIPAGTDFFIRTYASCATASQVFPITNAVGSVYSRGEGSNIFLNPTAGTGGGSDVTVAGSPAWSATWNIASMVGTPAPFAIFGDSNPAEDAALPPIALVGDSIIEAVQDKYWDPAHAQTNAGGYAVRAMQTAALPYIQFAQNGRSMQNLTDANRRVDWFSTDLLERCLRGIINMGRNDLTAARTLAQFQADAIDVWTYLTTTRGLDKLWQTTITPYTTSTDSWATTANQTLHGSANEAVRLTMNAWIRDGAPSLSGAAAATGSSAPGTLRAGAAGHPLAGYFEVADLAESARDSGKWKPGYTSDGIHPNPVGSAALFPAVDLAALVA